MRLIGKIAFWFGCAALFVGVVSRWYREPIQGIEAHAFLGFAQAAFLMATAAFVGERRD